MGKTGVCPIRSRDILEFALNALRERGAFPCLPEEAYREEAKALEALLPDRLLPEVYMDVPLMGGAFSGMAAVRTCSGPPACEAFSRSSAACSPRESAAAISASSSRRKCRISAR